MGDIECGFVETCWGAASADATTRRDARPAGPTSALIRNRGPAGFRRRGMAQPGGQVVPTGDQGQCRSDPKHSLTNEGYPKKTQMNRLGRCIAQ
jgi:hypothetical protein